jgi:hypothetical protein
MSCKRSGSIYVADAAELVIGDAGQDISGSVIPNGWSGIRI